MKRDKQPTTPPATFARALASVEVVTIGDASLVIVAGLVDEHFHGFGKVEAVKTLVLHVSSMTRMTSFGVRQWVHAMEQLPKTITDLYLLGCPTFFVDQLNMVLNFGGAGKVLTAIAPYSCPACNLESGELIDVLALRSTLTQGAPEKHCVRCGGKLVFDETPESYFAFTNKYAATSLNPAAAQLLAERRMYDSTDSTGERPPRIIKLVHGSVSYFRIIGVLGTMFRARPFLVGAEGEVIVDLADTVRFDLGGQKEWRRLMRSLANQVTAITLVDVPTSFLATAGDSLTSYRNLAVATLLAPYVCVECGKTSQVSENLVTMTWPPQFADRVCTTCGGITRSTVSLDVIAPLQKVSTKIPIASARVVERRHELMSRAMTDASVAQATSEAPTLAPDDVVLGKYNIVKALSAGGMADVYLATQVGIGGFEKPVAIKRIQNKLLETRHQAIELFLNEAKIAGRLQHSNIVQVIDVGEENGALYIAMEYVHGKDLRVLLKTLRKAAQKMPLADACFIVREVAQALDYAFWSNDGNGKRLSVVHRDVSPHNVILGYDGTVKLLDFGVAISSITEHEQSLVVGKWTYMSPETTMNGKTDHRSDLFSLGVVLYQLCSGTVPFGGSEPKEIVRKIRAGEYTALEQRVPQIPPRLAALVGRMLAPNPEDRPQRGNEVVAELVEIARECGFDSSAQTVADFIEAVFADELDRTSSVREIVRIYPGEPSSEQPAQTGADRSVTPSARTSRGSITSQSFRNSIDASVSLRVPAGSNTTVTHSARQRAVEPTTLRTGSMVNMVIGIAIVGVLILVVYLIFSEV